MKNEVHKNNGEESDVTKFIFVFVLTTEFLICFNLEPVICECLNICEIEKY